MVFFGLTLLAGRLGLIKLNNYSQVRELHFLAGEYLFFLPFIGGFLLQSAPKLLNTKAAPSSIGLLLLATTVGGALTCPFNLPLAKLIFSLGAFSIFVALVLDLPKMDFATILRSSLYCFIGLLSFTAIPFTDSTNISQILVIIWLGPVGILLATIQQFMVGVLEGRRPTIVEATLTFILFLLSTPALLQSNPPPIARAVALLCLLNFLKSCGIITILKKGLVTRIDSQTRDYFKIAFLSGVIWLPIGALVAALLSNAKDSILHAWALGCAATLIGVVSLRLIGWGRTDLKDPYQWNGIPYVIFAWHVFVASRVSLNLLPTISREILALSAILASLIILAWGIAIIQICLQKLSRNGPSVW